jgi:lipoate-protein ligase A
MAVDEALLASAAATSRATLRFYQWSRPTLSLGYFQRYVEREQHAASRACDVVRRATGGGAILHDRELTYSFTTPSTDRFSQTATALYELLHGALIESLAQWNIAAKAFGRPPSPGGGQQRFLCFGRRAEFDVVAGDVKIAGSAQRRRHGALLQHGSVLLARSPAAPEFSGLAEISGLAITAEALCRGWQVRLERRLEMTCRPESLTAAETAAARQIAAEKYASADWTLRR